MSSIRLNGCVVVSVGSVLVVMCCIGNVVLLSGLWIIRLLWFNCVVCVGCIRKVMFILVWVSWFLK